jgi:hypothetical protein
MVIIHSDNAWRRAATVYDSWRRATVYDSWRRAVNYDSWRRAGEWRGDHRHYAVNAGSAVAVANGQANIRSWRVIVGACPIRI